VVTVVDATVKLTGQYPPPFKPQLAQQRQTSVARLLHDAGATSVVELGCGDGALMKHLLHPEPSVRARSLLRSTRLTLLSHGFHRRPQTWNR
jgi:hypothetical protein